MSIVDRYAALWRLAKETSDADCEQCVHSDGPCVHDDLVSFLADPANIPSDHDQAVHIVQLLTAINPDYDAICCFFCHAYPSGQVEHQDDCPWWLARQLLGLPAWPTEDEIANAP